MPTPSKGARLYLKPAEIDKRTGKVRKASVWLIKDGSTRIVTGCAPLDRAGAEAALAEYIATKYAPEREPDQAAKNILVTDVLTIYAEDVVPNQARPEKCDQRLMQLAAWWQGKTLADVSGKTCRAYVKWRTSQPWKSSKPEKTGNKPRMVTEAGARRELEDLQAAVNHHRREGYTREVVEVTLPAKSQAKVRWLTRDEAARLLWTCWRTREVQTVHRGIRKGEKVETAKYPWRHLVPFILTGLYTGSRSKAISKAAFAEEEGFSFVDLNAGLFYRLAVGAKETNKRQPPVRLPRKLQAFMQRWAEQERTDGSARAYVVEFNGEPVGEVNKGFAAAVEAAGLGPDVTPHVLRHTCATWLMQNGADMWDAAGFLGMSVTILERVYGHHHPDHQASALEALEGKRKKPAKKEQKEAGGPDGVRMTQNKARRAK